MKLNVNKEDFLKRLNIGGLYANKGKLLAILSCVKIEVKDGILVITSTDSESEIKTYTRTYTCGVDSLAFCVEAKDITNYVKMIKDEIFDIDYDGVGSIEIIHSNGKAKFPTFDASEFPIIEAESEYVEMELDSNVIKSWISIGRNFVGNDEFRPTMNGLYLYGTNEELGCCATDGHTLFTDNLKVENGSLFKFILNKNAMLSLLSLLDECSIAKFKVGSRFVVVRCGASKLTTRLVEGNYPNFKSVLPKSQPISAIVNKKQLYESINRASIVGSKTSKLIKLSVNASEMIVSSQDIDFSTEGTEHVPCQSNGEIVIGINAIKLLDCLNAVNSSETTMMFSDSDRAITIHDAESDTKLILLMPLLLN